MIHVADEEYQQLLSDQLAKQEGEEIIAELEHENLLLKEELKIAIPKENLRRYLNWIHKRIYQLADENELFKVANAELRDKLDTVASMIKQGFGEDNCSFYDLLRKIERLV